MAGYLQALTWYQKRDRRFGRRVSHKNCSTTAPCCVCLFFFYILILNLTRKLMYHQFIIQMSQNKKLLLFMPWWAVLTLQLCRTNSKQSFFTFRDVGLLLENANCFLNLLDCCLFFLPPVISEKRCRRTWEPHKINIFHQVWIVHLGILTIKHIS